MREVRDYVGWRAEVSRGDGVEVALAKLVSREGDTGRADGSGCETDVAIIGYGKLGGIELGYTSDLDLVFVHKADPELATDGEKPIDNAVFYTRLGQRIVHILNTQTPSGQLYEVDMRLRPSGNSGLLVSTLQAFEKYQREDAWTWEHQALVRSRVVAGDPNLAADFDKVRDQVLRQPRDMQSLATEVQQMREKMRKHLGRGTKDGKFSLKQGTGGIVDIEFMVQYAVLLWSYEAPSLCQWTDNIRLLESLHNLGLLDADHSKQLTDIYQLYRVRGHRLALQQSQSSLIVAALFDSERKQIQSLWNYFFNEG